MSLLHLQLNQQQRKVADSVIISMCRGDYAASLRMIEASRKMGQPLPPLQERILRMILLRLLSPRAAEQYRLRITKNGLDTSMLFMEEIPFGMLGKVYEQAVTLSFERFHKHLVYMQLVEHTIMQHKLTFQNHCVMLKLVLQEIDDVHSAEGITLEMAFIHLLVISSLMILAYIFFKGHKTSYNYTLPFLSSIIESLFHHVSKF